MDGRPSWNYIKVLIESDWNLKIAAAISSAFLFGVLIESDWNLKQGSFNIYSNVAMRINRIRLEFKVLCSGQFFKYQTVLIESDWNLKDVRSAFYIMNSQY